MLEKKISRTKKVKNEDVSIPSTCRERKTIRVRRKTFIEHVIEKYKCFKQLIDNNNKIWMEKLSKNPGIDLQGCKNSVYETNRRRRIIFIEPFMTD